jgi:polyisoprenyl-phosphate glycosyltransferase
MLKCFTMKHAPHLTIVTPVYHARASLVSLYERIKLAVESSITKEFELIMVDDASPDLSWEIIEKLVEQDPRVKGIQLTRNFGQYYALTAGLDQARGEWVVILDCDLQDRPEEIPNLYAKAQEGFDIVLAQRIERHDSALKKASSWAFYKVFSYLTDTVQDPSTAQFGIYHQRVIHTFTHMREQLRFLPAFIQWVGYATTAIPVQHAQRESGKSSYSFGRLLNLALDTMIAFSDKPLRLVIKLGLIISVIALVYAGMLIVEKLMGRPNILGWPSLMVSIWFFSGLNIFVIGMIGLYVGKIFAEVKHRPLYLINQIKTNPDRTYDDSK